MAGFNPKQQHGPPPCGLTTCYTMGGSWRGGTMWTLDADDWRMCSNNQGITLLSLCQSAGRTMWIPSWMWKSGPTLYPNKDPGEVWEFPYPVYLSLVGLEKANNCIPRHVFYGVLWKYGAPELLISAARSLYNQCESVSASLA